MLGLADDDEEDDVSKQVSMLQENVNRQSQSQLFFQKRKKQQLVEPEPGNTLLVEDIFEEGQLSAEKKPPVDNVYKSEEKPKQKDRYILDEEQKQQL